MSKPISDDSRESVLGIWKKGCPGICNFLSFFCESSSAISLELFRGGSYSGDMIVWIFLLL